MNKDQTKAIATLLRVDGKVDAAQTVSIMRKHAKQMAILQNVATLQTALNELLFQQIKVDNRWGPATERCLRLALCSPLLTKELCSKLEEIGFETDLAKSHSLGARTSQSGHSRSPVGFGVGNKEQGDLSHIPDSYAKAVMSIGGLIDNAFIQGKNPEKMSDKERYTLLILPACKVVFKSITGDYRGFPVCDWVYQIIRSESSWRNKVVSNTSSATGLGQFTLSTWNGFKRQNLFTSYGVIDDRTDPWSSVVMMAHAIKTYVDNILARGLSPNAGSVYAMHFMWTKGRDRYFSDPGLSPQWTSDELRYNSWLSQIKTCGEFAALMDRKMARGHA